jgi:acetylornithine deacetylase
VLSGHTDVVPVDGQTWSGHPFKLREASRRLYGRGVCDMKGFDACVLAMAPAFRDAGLKRPVHIVLSYDEETTCLGSRDVIAWFGRDEPAPAAVIVGEPTMMEVADAHKSVATLRTLVTGREAHSALPALGANAVAAAADIVSEIGRLARAYEEGPLDPRFTPPYSTLHVGMIRGGTARNILARECMFHWEFRGLPGVPTASALAKVQAFVDAVAAPRLTRFVSGPTIQTALEVDVPPLAAEPGSAAETLALRLTRSNRTIAVSFATEAGHFQAAGLPTVVCGPGSIDQAHKPDEFVDEAQLAACLDFLQSLADDLAR